MFFAGGVWKTNGERRLLAPILPNSTNRNKNLE